MADSFNNPGDQASFSELANRLNALAAKGQESAALAVKAQAEALAEQRVVARQRAGGLDFGAAAGRVQAASEGGVGAAATAQERLATAERQSLAGAETRTRTIGLQATGEDRLALALQSERRALAGLDDSLTRHGALTTEFLGALARGEVTLKQFGDQILQTIGKFSGWALAAGGVYAVLGALTEVRKGAIDTGSAIQGLTRFIPELDKGKAQQQIITTAQDTVTPVADVGNAAQQFARIFKNQDDVFTATHVALTASKLDNIQLSDSYRYLTALVQEYGLKASDLPGVFDQITAAQDRLGAKVSEVFPALARSAAAIKNSGGDLNQALALEALTIVRTGQTGNTVGTGYSRGASNFYKTPSAQASLQGLGIDPAQGFTQALVEAITKAPSFTGDQKRELSKAFFGPLRGGQLASLFNAGPEQLNKFIGQTSADNTRGLADKQLATVTGQADQRIKELGIDLQGLGAALATSGLLTDLGLFVALLNSFLQATTQLLQVYNTLPGTLKEAAGALGGFVAVAALLRRFGVIDSVQAFRKQETGYLGTTIGSLTDESRGLARQGNSVVTAAENQRLASEQAHADVAAGVAGAEERAAEHDAKLLALLDQQAAIQTERELIGTQINALQAELATVEGASRSQVKARRELLAINGGTPELAAARTTANEAETVAAGQATTAIEAQAVATQQLSLFQAEAVVETEALAVTTGTTMVASLGAAAAAMKSFLFGLGGLAIAAGGFIAYEGAKHINQADEKGSSDLSKAKTAKEARDAVQRATNPGGITAALEGLFYTPDDQTGKFDPKTGKVGKSDLQLQLDQELGRIDAESKAKDLGTSKLAGIQQNLQNSLAAAHTSGERVAAIKQALTDLGNDKALALVAPGQFEAAKGRLTALLDSASNTQKSMHDYLETLSSAKDLQHYTTETQTTFDIQGPNSTEGFKRASATIARLSELIGATTNQADLKSLVAQWRTNRDLIKQNASTSLTQDLSLAGTDPTAQGTARTDYLQKLQQPLTATRNALKSFTDDQKTANDRIAEARRRLAQIETESFGGLAGADARATEIASLKTQIGKLTEAAGKSHDGAKALRQLLEQQLKDQQVARAEMAKANEEAQIALNDAKGAYQQAGTQDPFQQASIDYNTTAQDLATFIASGVNDPVKRLTLMTKLRADATKKVDAALTAWQSQQDLSLARADLGASQDTQTANAVSGAQQLVAHLQALGSQVSPDKLAQAQKALISAQASRLAYQVQEGRAQIDANASLTESTTNDPTVIARQELARAKRLLAYDQAHAASQSALTKDQADVNDKRKSLQKSILDQQLQSIQFRADTQQIGQAQEISQLQALLARMKKAHASLSDIQGIEKEIFNLTNGSGNLNLNVGSLRLPSTYEVRKAITGGINSNRRQTTAGLLADVQTHVDMKIIVNRDTDIGKFSKALTDALGSGVDGLAKAAGLV